MKKSHVIYGEYAPLLKEGFTLSPDAVINHLHELPLHKDYKFPLHRRHLSAKEILFAERLVLWRFGYQTFNQPFPALSSFAKACGMSARQATRVCKFLERQGLLLVKRSLCGLAHQFDIRPLLNRIVALFGGEQQPKPAPIPEPEPEPEPLPIAAIERAPEWELSFPQIQKHVSKAEFNTWFVGTRAFRQDGLLVIETRSAYQKQRLLMGHFADIITSIFGAGCWAVAVAKASA